ncbi:hypothetical protein RJ640_014163 [Escallonia rubra]|uniref:Uncharacterized protein n=1 Tax=Escallonia rubra TaxID=112253 RepID=A0AA88RSU6_9ASTE|nr:hypothetical protein RJ640_014163 [Escallonia rubra]
MKIELGLNGKICVLLPIISFGINSILGTNYQPKISFNAKNTNYFCNGIWNDINSYLFIIYVTSQPTHTR